MTTAISSPSSFSSQLHPVTNSSSSQNSVDLGRSIVSGNKEFVTRNLNPRDPALSSRNLNVIKPIPQGTPPDRPPLPDLVGTAPTGVDPDEAAKSQCSSVVLPSCAQWFSLDTINGVERAQISTLFADVENIAAQEEKYKAIRNNIVKTYRLNPRQYLSVTECRKSMDGDAALLLRIHSFLDYWGIINFQADPSTLPSRCRKPRDFRLSDTLNGDPVDDKTRGFDKWGSKVSPAKPGGGPWKCAACGKICVYTYYVIRPGGTTGISMGVLDKCVWCLKCYAAGRYPSVLNEKQFLKVELPIMGGEGDASEEWTYEETERLIEGIELYKEDWESVARHVGGDKTSHQCVSYFIQMPIQEPLMSDDEDEECRDVHPGQANVPSRSMPFEDSPNPLLTQLAFLSSMVNPNVASAAAKAALNAAVEIGSSSQENTASNQAQAVDLPSKAPTGFVSDGDMQVICGTALAAAAVRAKELARAEENEIKKLMPEVVDLQLQRLHLKTQHFRAIEQAIAEQRKTLEGSLHKIMAEHRDVSAKLQEALAMGKI